MCSVLKKRGACFSTSQHAVWEDYFAVVLKTCKQGVGWLGPTIPTTPRWEQVWSGLLHTTHLNTEGLPIHKPLKKSYWKIYEFRAKMKPRNLGKKRPITGGKKVSGITGTQG